MKKFVGSMVGSLILVLAPDAVSTELMLKSSEPRVTVLRSPNGQASKRAQFLVFKKPSADAVTVAKQEAVSDRLANYPEGTVALVFWDEFNNLKGVLPLLPQSERMIPRFSANSITAFEPSTQIVDFPEGLAAKFEKTDVWQKSNASSVEHLASFYVTK